MDVNSHQPMWFWEDVMFDWIMSMPFLSRFERRVARQRGHPLYLDLDRMLDSHPMLTLMLTCRLFRQTFEKRYKQELLDRWMRKAMSLVQRHLKPKLLSELELDRYLFCDVFRSQSVQTSDGAVTNNNAIINVRRIEQPASLIVLEVIFELSSTPICHDHLISPLKKHAQTDRQLYDSFFEGHYGWPFQVDQVKFGDTDAGFTVYRRIQKFIEREKLHERHQFLQRCRDLLPERALHSPQFPHYQLLFFNFIYDIGGGGGLIDILQYRQIEDERYGERLHKINIGCTGNCGESFFFFDSDSTAKKSDPLVFGNEGADPKRLIRYGDSLDEMFAIGRCFFGGSDSDGVSLGHCFLVNLNSQCYQKHTS